MSVYPSLKRIIGNKILLYEPSPWQAGNVYQFTCYPIIVLIFLEIMKSVIPKCKFQKNCHTCENYYKIVLIIIVIMLYSTRKSDYRWTWNYWQINIDIEQIKLVLDLTARSSNLEWVQGPLRATLNFRTTSL